MSDTGTSAMSKTSVGVVAGGYPRKFSRHGTNKTPVIPPSTEAEASSLGLLRAAEERRLQSLGGALPSEFPGEREKRVSTPVGDPRVVAGSSATARGAPRLTRIGPMGELERSGVDPPGKLLEETPPR